MPVQKFRSINEMNRAPIRVVGESAFDRFVRHCRRYRLISKLNYLLAFSNSERSKRHRPQGCGDNYDPSKIEAVPDCVVTEWA